MAKPRVTKTYGPIHFEDLDPHRFEDLIRELIYDYKDWQSIEATGRSGSDEGFDIRAYEKAASTSTDENEEDGEVDEIHPMEGNLWMIQGKREKEIGPKKVKSIISDVNEKNPPYGYILAASVNFSKKSYDIFREELRKKGVMEFYLWGKAELEDMLHLPKNDRILFTFFGISLVSKRRSKATEIRSAINMKNKLYKCVGERNNFRQSILIRDLKDTYYPFKFKYKDFEKRPRWKEYIAFAHHPLGLWCHNHEYFAYIDTDKKEWDFTKEVDLIYRESERDKELRTKQNKHELVEDIWGFFPKSNQGHFASDFLVKYSDIVTIDDKGDVLCNFPHLYVDFSEKMGPFAGYREFLKFGDKEIDLTDKYKRINIFPKKFTEIKIGKIYEDKKIILNAESLKVFNQNGLDTIYESGGEYNFLKPRDIILVDNQDQGSNAEDMFIQITHKNKTKIRDHLKQIELSFRDKRIFQLQVGNDYDDNDDIYIYMFKRIYKHQFEKSKNNI